MVEPAEQPREKTNRRRVLPSYSVLLLFVVYLISTWIVIYVLYGFDRMSRDLRPSFEFQWISTVCLFGLGLSLFYTVRQYFELKFLQFLTRLEFDLWSHQGVESCFIQFRKSLFTPWAIQELNSVLQYASIPIVETKRLLDELKEEFQRQKELGVLYREDLLDKVVNLEYRLYQVVERAPAQAQPNATPGIFNLLTLKGATFWTGFYALIFLMLWFSVPLWAANEYSGEHGNLLHGTVLINGVVVYSFLIGAISYLWISFGHLKFINRINQDCRRYLKNGNVNMIRVMPRQSYSFFTSALKFYLMRNEERRREILDKIESLKRSLSDDNRKLDYNNLDGLF